MAIAVRGTGWDPFSALVRQFDSEFDTLVRRAFGGNGDRTASGFVPAADITRDGSDVVITLELPGIDAASDVDVSVAHRKLVISGRRSEHRTDDTRGALVREIRTGSFRREFALPEHVTGEHVDAGYENGLLTVRVREVARPAVEPTKVQVRGLPAAEPSEPSESEQN